MPEGARILNGRKVNEEEDMPTEGRRVLSCLAIGAVVLAWPAGSAAESNQFETAAFTTSSDPSAVVLFVQVSYRTMPRESRAMRLFGDGRLEITSSGDRRPVQKRERRLDEAAQRELVGLAVRHGLAEWDATRIESEKALALNGRQFTTADGSLVSVRLTLETYAREGVERTGVSKRVDLANPLLTVERFPNIPEFKGVLELQLYLRRLLKEEGMA